MRIVPWGSSSTIQRPFWFKSPLHCVCFGKSGDTKGLNYGGQPFIK